MSKIIYVVSPYTHKDHTVVQHRFKKVTEYAAKLVHDRNMAFSPITYGHILCQHQDMPTDFNFWEDFCLSFLLKADVVHVLKLDGYLDSVGVNAEIEFAIKHNIPVLYIDVE
jgi:hypothetical protein